MLRSWHLTESSKKIIIWKIRRISDWICFELSSGEKTKLTNPPGDYCRLCEMIYQFWGWTESKQSSLWDESNLLLLHQVGVLNLLIQFWFSFWNELTLGFISSYCWNELNIKISTVVVAENLIHPSYVNLLIQFTSQTLCLLFLFVEQDVLTCQTEWTACPFCSVIVLQLFSCLGLVSVHSLSMSWAWLLAIHLLFWLIHFNLTVYLQNFI